MKNSTLIRLNRCAWAIFHLFHVPCIQCVRTYAHTHVLIPVWIVSCHYGLCKCFICIQANKNKVIFNYSGATHFVFSRPFAFPLPFHYSLAQSFCLSVLPAHYRYTVHVSNAKPYAIKLRQIISSMLKDVFIASPHPKWLIYCHDGYECGVTSQKTRAHAHTREGKRIFERFQQDWYHIDVCLENTKIQIHRTREQ